MSVEKAIITRVMPLISLARVEHFLDEEKRKGCDPGLYPFPVALEPPFFPIGPPYHFPDDPNAFEVCPESVPRETDLVRFEVWLSPKEEPSWLKNELFLKQLTGINNRIGFEVIGNRKQIHIGFMVHREDIPFLETSFQGSFEEGELKEAPPPEVLKELTKVKRQISFLDLYPPPPYSHLLTRPEEFKISPYQAFISALMRIEYPDCGFYQALFQPVHPRHNWHMNVDTLLDIEYVLKLMSSQIPQRYLQQAPSGDLRQMAKDVETKSHSDKPFFALACRIGAISESDPQQYMKPLSIFFNLFQHGGRPMQFITDYEYRRFLSVPEILTMFRLGLTYRSGFLVNSSELSGPVHLPPSDILHSRTPQINVIETVPVENQDIQEGTPLGTYKHLGETHKVCIPLHMRTKSTHIIGRPGMAKSTTMAHMILDDIQRGTGVAVIDPHGDLVKDLLLCIPQKFIKKTVYLDFTIQGQVPIWNPLHRSRGQDIIRTTEDIIAALKTVFRSGWGDRMEHLLRHGIFALSHLPGSTLQDLSQLLFKRDRKSSIRDEPLLMHILEVLDNEVARSFWQHHVWNYDSQAFDPPKHRLDKVLLSGKVALMLSQPDCLIDFRQIMDEGKICLVNLSLIGREVMEVLGCFILSLLHLTSLGRGDVQAGHRKSYQIYVDEAPRFVTDTMEDLIAESRKFGVGLTLAHQFLSQFGTVKIDALSSVGTTIIMNVDRKDASYLVKDLGEKVEVNDLINLKLGEAVVRIFTDIVKIETLGPLKIPEKNYKEEILRYSLSQYYRSEKEVKESIKRKNERYNGAIVPVLTQNYNDDLECDFDQGF